MRRLSGFSLMEMMIVLAIVAVVAAASAPMMNKKMVRSINEGQSLWSKVNNTESIAYNFNGAGINNNTVNIGGLAPNGETAPRLYIHSNGVNPHISFGKSGSHFNLWFGNDDSIGLTTSSFLHGGSSIAIGVQAEATGYSSIAIGSDTGASSENSIAIGPDAHPNGKNSIAMGKETQANGNYSVVIGSDSSVATTDAISIGRGNTIGGGQDIAIGSGIKTEGGSAIAIGSSVWDDNTNSAAITKAASESIAMGDGAQATGRASIAIGSATRATAEKAVAIGFKANASRVNQITLGNNESEVYIPGDLIVQGKLIVKDEFVPIKLVGTSLAGGLYKGTTSSKAVQVKTDATKTSTAVSLINSYGLSDRRLKNVGEVFKAGLNEIKKLEVFNYTFKDDKDKTPRVGVIAQDLKKIFPDAVIKGNDGFLRIRMEDMFYALVNAVKELDSRVSLLEQKQKQINELESQVNKLTTQVNNLEKRLTDLEKSK